MQHIKGIQLLLSILFVIVLTNITAICVADAGSRSQSGNSGRIQATDV